ncbi:SatD family protein [Nocardioides taihuensis]|uniref:SatD family protein n=1 Tax=Nocardioides taihuensis TaxID=1835606 RepID=A0ABW0BIW4_9ACTN
MPEMKRTTATLLGDLVGSRTTADRPALHERLVAVLDEGNEVLGPTVPLRITVGDEYQGCFDDVGSALHAALWLRVALLPACDQRHGIGWGEVGVLAESPRVEDGPGWWAARDAIEAAAEGAARPGLRHLRTAYRRAEGAAGPDPAAVNAALVCRDHLLGSLGERSLRLLRGVLAGRSQVELAREEGVSPSAVSQRVRHDGLAALLAADDLLRGVR